MACRRGLSNACVNNLDRTIGNSDKLDGAFADYIWLPELEIMATKMPQNLSFEDGALTEPLATSVHAVRISQFQVGDTVVVAGAGPIGLLAIQALKVGGAGRIIVSQSPGPRRELALELGADEAGNPRDPDNPVGDQIQKITDGGVDVVIECAGAYGFVMGSNYNSKPLAAEVLVRDGEAHLIRRRQSFEDVIRGEVIPEAGDG